MTALPIPYRPVAGMLISLLALNGCAAYRLTDKTPQYPQERHMKATTGLCAVGPFRYTPADAGDADLMTPADLARWDELFYEAVHRSDICGRAPVT